MTTGSPPRPLLAVNLPTLTWSDFDRHYPCYDPREQYGDWSGTILDLLQRYDIPAEDRIWALSREGLLDARLQRLCAVAFVRQTPLGDGRFVADLLTDERSRRALTVSESYAYGKASYRESVAARAAAWDAVISFNKNAVGAAARAVYWASSENAAADASADAARVATWGTSPGDVAVKVSWAAVMAAQVQIAIRVITYHTAV